MNLKPGNSIAIVAKDLNGNRRSAKQIAEMTDEINKIIEGKYGFRIYHYGELEGVFRTVHKDRVITALKEELKESFGSLSRDEAGEESNGPYMIIGVVASALERIKIKSYER